RMQTPAQQRAENFGRTLTLTTADTPLTLNWTLQQPLTEATVTNMYKVRATAKGYRDVGYRAVQPQETAALLPHLYQFVLPIKIADCLHELNQFEKAHQEYLRASRFEQINASLEAPDLWRRLAENVADWGDSLYRDDQTPQATPIYTLLMTDGGVASNSVLYTT